MHENPQISLSRLGRHQLYQPRQGYRFSMDSVLLAGFAQAVQGPVADLGAGCGILDVLLAAGGLPGPFTCLELDPVAVECCRRNLEGSGIEGEALEADLNQPLPELPSGAFKLVISNPPYYRPGSGRVPPDPSRARARHGLALEPARLWALAARLLPMGGRLVFCWPAAGLPEALAGVMAWRLTPKRLRLVHGRQGREANLALIEAIKDGGPQLTVEPPLIAYGEGQQYSEEVQAIYDRLCGPGPRP